MSVNTFAGELLDGTDWQWPSAMIIQAPPRFRLFTADQFKELPKQEWAAKHLLPSIGLAAFFGASGSGKSFLVIDLIAKLAEGGIHTRDDLADLAVDELTDMTAIDDDRAKALIMKAREHWFTA